MLPSFLYNLEVIEMTDYRIVTDEELNRYYVNHQHIRYCDMHDDFAIAYIFGIQYQFSYDEDKPNHSEIIGYITAEYERLKGVTLYREHRGSLDDSMQTVIEVKSKAELREHILKVDDWASKAGKLTIKKYGTKPFDERIGWDTYIVMWNTTVMGFTNGPLD